MPKPVLGMHSEKKLTFLTANPVAASAAAGLAVRKVNFFSNAGGLSTANATFTFAATSNTSVFKSFTRSNGSAQGAISLFTF